MDYQEHFKTTGTALKHWFVATLQDAAAVGAIWLVGLLIIGVPLAPFWALLGALFQFVPGIGAVLALIGPALALLFSDKDMMSLVYLLILYAIIAVVDGLVLQPYFMKRTAKVPLWASIVVPIVCGIVLPFWGVLLAPPLLAVVYAFRAKNRELLAGDTPRGDPRQ